MLPMDTEDLSLNFDKNLKELVRTTLKLNSEESVTQFLTLLTCNKLRESITDQKILQKQINFYHREGR